MGDVVSRLRYEVWRRYQHLVDKTAPYVLYRWIFFAMIASIYVLRVILLKGFALVTFMLGHFAVEWLVHFLSPRDDTALPTRSSDEFRPFVRLLPEHELWILLVAGFSFALILTFFSVFDVHSTHEGVILMLMFWFFFFLTSMSDRIKHMIKHKYVPFTSTSGKLRYGKQTAPIGLRAATI